MSTPCPFCGAAKLHDSKRVTREKIAGHCFVETLQILDCAECGEATYPPGVLTKFQLHIAWTLARAGIVEPEAVRFMRSALGLSGVSLARLFGVRPESISRWEHGKRGMDRATLVVFHQLIEGRINGDEATFRLLHELEKPPKLPKQVLIVSQRPRKNTGPLSPSMDNAVPVRTAGSGVGDAPSKNQRRQRQKFDRFAYPVKSAEVGRSRKLSPGVGRRKADTNR